MSTLTEKLISILERERGGPVLDPDAEKPDTSIPLPVTPDGLRYECGKVFHASPGQITNAAILARTSPTECMLITLPEGNRWDDNHVFLVPAGFGGPTIEEFHRAYGDRWQVSRRGKEALEEWARTDV